MFGFKTFTAGLVLGIGSAMFISHYHVVHTKEGVVVVPRTVRPPLRSSYVDIRTWGEAMWVNHPEVTQALISNGRSSLIGENLKENLLDDLLPNEAQAPARARNVAVAEEIPQRVGQLDEIVPGPRRQPRSGSIPNTFQSESYSTQAGQMLDQVLAPIVDEELETPVVNSLLPSSPRRPARDELVGRMPAPLGDVLDPPKYSRPTERSAGRLEGRSRELIRQIIPPMSNPPRSATPLRDLSRDWLSAPAPGSSAPAPLDGVLNEIRIEGIEIQ